MDVLEMRCFVSEVERLLDSLLQDAAIRYFTDRPYMKRTKQAEEIILAAGPLIGRTPYGFMSDYVYGHLKMLSLQSEDADLPLREAALAFANEITKETDWSEIRTLMRKYGEVPLTNAHLHAIDPSRQQDTELIRLATVTLRKAIQCEHCSYRLALITDAANDVSDSEVDSVFRNQIALLQEALTEDHDQGHPHWRFVADIRTCVPLAKGNPKHEITLVM